MARPSGRVYRFQKLVRRNKLVFGAVAAVAAALVGGAAVSTYLAVRANQAEGEQSRLRQQADHQRQEAEHLRTTAEDQARQIGRQFYASHMNVAFQTWQKGDLTRVERLLDELRPKPDAEDLRGFEWFYLWGLCHSDQLTLHGHHAMLRCVTFSPDGRLVATAGDDSTARIWDAFMNCPYPRMEGVVPEGATSFFIPPLPSQS